MTYCVAIKCRAGLVFLSDSRTNAGVDQISTFRKMIVYEQPGDRFMVLLSAGNLSISQSVRELFQSEKLLKEDTGEAMSMWNCTSMFDAARILGSTIRHVHARDAQALQAAGVDFNVSLLFGGQIKGEAPRLFQFYSPGNFIEATDETPYFQIGESKYGKPVLDRVINPEIGLNEAAKCALVSMDSTLKSNLSVGLPLDMAVYETNQLKSDQIVAIDHDNAYFKMLHQTWGERLREMFDRLDDPVWKPDSAQSPLSLLGGKVPALRKLHNSEDRLI